MTACEEWKENLLVALTEKEEIIASEAFHGGEASLKARLLEAMKGTLTRDPSMQTVMAMIEEM